MGVHEGHGGQHPPPPQREAVLVEVLAHLMSGSIVEEEGRGLSVEKQTLMYVSLLHDVLQDYGRIDPLTAIDITKLSSGIGADALDAKKV